MSNTNPLVTVIIPCRNEGVHIRKCVEAIYKSDYDRKNYEVIIAEGRSTDHTHNEIQKLKHKFPEVKVLDNEKQITPAAFNMGMERGEGHYLITIGSRHFISQNYLSTCVSILDSNSQIAGVGGKSICIESSPAGEVIAKAMSSAFGVGYTNFRSISESKFVDTVGTPMYRKSVLEAIGGFDESLVRNQDDELSYRIAKSGFKIYQSNAISVAYVARDSFSKLFKQLFQYGYWKVYVNRKHRTITTIRQLAPPLFVLYIFIVIIWMSFDFWGKKLLCIPLASYFLLAFVESYKAAGNYSEIIKMVGCFFIMHISYGLGYLQGVIHFLIINRKPSETSKELSR